MRKADNLPPSCAVVTKSGNLNFLEPSGPVQACNGTALPLPFMYLYVADRIRTHYVEKPIENRGVPIGTHNVYCFFAEM